MLRTAIFVAWLVAAVVLACTAAVLATWYMGWLFRVLERL